MTGQPNFLQTDIIYPTKDDLADRKSVTFLLQHSFYFKFEN